MKGGVGTGEAGKDPGCNLQPLRPSQDPSHPHRGPLRTPQDPFQTTGVPCPLPILWWCPAPTKGPMLGLWGPPEHPAWLEPVWGPERPSRGTSGGGSHAWAGPRGASAATRPPGQGAGQGGTSFWWLHWGTHPSQSL